MFMRLLELSFLSLNARRSAILTNFCNPEIPVLERRLSRDLGLAKTAGILGFGIPGLQFLVLWERYQHIWTYVKLA